MSPGDHPHSQVTQTHSNKQVDGAVRTVFATKQEDLSSTSRLPKFQPQHPQKKMGVVLQADSSSAMEEAGIGRHGLRRLMATHFSQIQELVPQ